MNKGEFEMLLFAIARIHLNIDTLETRYSDRLDFHDCAVWCIRAMGGLYLDPAQQSPQSVVVFRNGRKGSSYSPLVQMAH